MIHSSKTDGELVAGALAGDRKCVNEIISRYEVEVFRIGMNLTSDESVAKGVVEEVFVRLSRELEAISRDGRPFLDCLHGFAYDACLTRLISGRSRGGSFQHLFSIGKAMVEGERSSSSEEAAPVAESSGFSDPHRRGVS